MSAEISIASSITPLPFNPVKLLCLVAWVYICLYFVQHAQFSLLVPRRYKSVAYIITLFAGPILLLSVLIVDTVKKCAKREDGILGILKQQVQNTIEGMRSARFKHLKDDSTVKLLDSSGRNIDQVYGHGDNKHRDRHVFDLAERIIADALQRRASDILIDPKDESTYTIRLRLDGVLRTVKQLKAQTSKAVVNSIKVVSSMDISEKRRPQDGAFMVKKGQETAFFRVASAGVLYGEKLSMDLFDSARSIIYTYYRPIQRAVS